MVNDNMLVLTVIILILDKKNMQYFIIIYPVIIYPIFNNLSDFIIIYVTYTSNRRKLK